MKHEHTHSTHNPSATGVIDPVCGMTVDPATAKHKAEHQGQSYYFCSA
ncbi:MAG TPA: YHS domain-containing protein, partial [Aestuariivirga sp.]|nr:YHS domain-containing protein [Aestuariivirga sp.]